ncbi:hypothetical protein QR680_007922 [Steinernema hermaphroditum]|uniref:SWI/SNF-related matrix-associated actin-dependent regulator of chromatin subfamily A containing DEAD/H box 1 homolog n=1 Tax=Steinernema hermaphroditum TaxID=289476 RepID=A0AA39IEQ1_9BILA|nr:hypothetical protein QR680_007922 [Steinernema hermaphroditum]
MSSDEEEVVVGKRRIAHQTSSASSALVNELAYKKNSLSKITTNGAKSQKSARQAACSKSTKKRVKTILSSDDDDFDIVPHASYQQPGQPVKIKKETSRREFVVGFNGSEIRNRYGLNSEDAFAYQKNRNGLKQADGTLSDSSDDGQWLTKPKFLPTKDVHQKLPAPPSIKFVAKRSRIMSTSSEEEHDLGTSKNTLKSVVKQARQDAKRRKLEIKDESESEEEVELPDKIFSENEDEEDAAVVAAMERQFSGDSDDSGAEQENRAAIDSKQIRAKCLDLFNTATREELLALPRSGDKLVEFIVNSRPFSSFNQLEEQMSSVARGQALVDSQFEHFENRGVLEKILDDCEENTKQIQDELNRMMTQTLQVQPKTLHTGCTLHPYQQIGLNWMMMMDRLGLSGILADEMGLGKTIQVIAFLTHLKETRAEGPHLIIVPSSTIENWMGEIAKWSPTLRVETYYGSQAERSEIASRAKKIRKEADVLLTTYNMVCSKPEDRKFFKKFSINYIVYDEGHMLKSCATARYQTLMKIRGKRKLLLTGTPLQNNLCELISLMYFTMPKLFSRYCEDISQLLQQFQRKQSNKEGQNSSTALYEKSTIEQAKAILAPYVLRRLKANVLDTLPKKLDNFVSIDMTSEQRDMYRTRVLDLRFQKNCGDYSSAGGLMQLRQIANHPLLTRKLYDEAKLEKIAKILCRKEREYAKKKPEHVAEDLSFLSDFAIHRLCEKFDTISDFMLEPEESLASGKCRKLDRILPEIKAKDILEVYLNVRGHVFCRLDGSTPVMERQELINEFNTNPEIFVFLLSTRAGGMGINLTAANNIILHDIDFNPYNDKQAEDRCHRMGQKRDVNIFRFVSKGTIEEGMYAAAKQKLELERDVTGQRGGDDKVDPQLVEALLTKALALTDD